MPRVRDDDDPRARPAPRRRRGDAVRVFIAAYPTPALVDRLAASARALPLPKHRVTSPDQVHLTLLFVGDVDPRDLDETVTSVERAAAGVGPFTLTLDRLATLPERGPARLVAAFAPPVDPLTELQGRLAQRLARRGRKRERFTPHLTLLRFRPPVEGFAVDEPLEPMEFPIETIAVMRSILKPGGAEHREVRAIRL